MSRKKEHRQEESLPDADCFSFFPLWTALGSLRRQNVTCLDSDRGCEKGDCSRMIWPSNLRRRSQEKTTSTGKVASSRVTSDSPTAPSKNVKLQSFKATHPSGSFFSKDPGVQHRAAEVKHTPCTPRNPKQTLSYAEEAVLAGALLP